VIRAEGRTRAIGPYWDGNDASRSLTAYNSAVPASSLRIALGWWAIGFPLAVLYLVSLFRLHRGKAAGATGRQGY
jgi:cytochrome bd-type quinol oxidase subunit 2